MIMDGAREADWKSCLRPHCDTKDHTKDATSTLPIFFLLSLASLPKYQSFATSSPNQSSRSIRIVLELVCSGSRPKSFTIHLGLGTQVPISPPHRQSSYLPLPSPPP